MEETEKSITPEESLAIITQMMTRARQNLSSGGSFYFIFWGVVVGCGNMAQFLIDLLTDYPHPYAVWLMIIPAVIVSTIYSIKKKNNTMLNSSFERIYGDIWWFIFGVMMLIILFGYQVNYQISPLIMLLSALGTFITGRMTKFKPLQIGGFILIATAATSFLLPFQYQPLVAALGITLGNTIPGFQLKAIGR